MNTAQSNLRHLVYDPNLVVEMILDRLQRSVDELGRAAMAIPGGRSPGPVLSVLAGRMPDAVRKRLHLFWVDERAVPPGHKERNSSTTLGDWEEGGPLPEYIYPMPAETQDLESAAREYAGLLAEVTDGLPLDLCLLGVGEDGHIASLFPHHPGLLRDEPVIAVYDSPKPPPRRLTLSLQVISTAGLRIILAPGREKGIVFKEASKGPDPVLPVSLLPRYKTVWFVDQSLVV